MVVTESRRAVFAQILLIISIADDESIAEEMRHEATGIVGLLEVVRQTDEQLDKHGRGAVLTNIRYVTKRSVENQKVTDL